MVPAVDRIRASSRARPGVGVPYSPSGARVVSSVTAQGAPGATCTRTGQAAGTPAGASGPHSTTRAPNTLSRAPS